MPSDFDFLRIKWPKMAALAADASRLVDISPSSAIASMRTFCEWAADIALDMYKVQVMSGATQMEKLEALQATGRVPTEILQKFHNIRTAGNDAVHRALGDADTAKASLLETKEIGQWLFRESDSHARPRDPSPIRRVPIEGLYGGDDDPAHSKSMLDSGRSNHFRPSQFFRQYGPQLVMGAGVVLVIGIIVIVVLLLSRCSDRTQLTPEDSVGPSSSPLVSETTVPPSSSPTIAPSPTPPPSLWLEDLEPMADFSSLYLGSWDSPTMNAKFQMNNTLYENGLGMFVPSSKITEEQGSKTATWALKGNYSTLVFDLGADQNWDYGQTYGYFRIKIYGDDPDTPLYESGMNDYQFFEENITVDVTGCQSLKITITEKKGESGTLNIVLGNAKLYETASAASATPDASPTTDASATAAASATPAG